MNNHFRLLLFIFIFFVSLFNLRLSAEEELPLSNPQTTISMDFKDVELKDLLKAFSIQSGSNFIASEAVQDRKITLYLDKVPVKEAMNKLFTANNLTYELDKQANIITVKDWGKPTVETVTKVFYLKYATVSVSPLASEKSTVATTTSSTTTSAGITYVITKLLSSNGSVIEDARTNSLIVTDIPGKMERIAQAIASLDVSVPQALLEVEMLDVSKNTTDKIGIKYGEAPLTINTIVRGASVPSKFPWGSVLGDKNKGITNGLFGFNTGTATTDLAPPSTYQILLNFLKTQVDTRVLARPRILTLNNETAEIKITTNEAIGSLTTVQGTGSSALTNTSAERVETGVSLRVTPQINQETGEITMFIVPKVKDATTSTFNTSFKDPEERSTKSVVRLKDGETVIIGGLIRNDRSETITKLPILGSIPLIGNLFRHRNKDKDKERELLVFITPHIVKEANIELAQAKKIVFPEREQNTISGINRQTIINRYLNIFDKKNR